jgi:hypothetical protein
MSVIVISDTAQEFLGVRYYLCGSYFQRYGKRLHRVVWSHYNGSIPKRAHIHHRDLDIANNHPDNLVCVTADEHLSFHGRLRAGESAANLAEHARPSAVDWHGSEAGREWHREHWEQHCKSGLFRRVETPCANCSQKFDGLAGRSRFCSNACKSAYRRRMQIDVVERKCEKCASAFRSTKFKEQRYCSLACSDPGRYERAEFEVACRLCGVTFTAKDRRAIWCSDRCRRRRTT